MKFTKREQDVLRHLLMGATNKRIASELGIAQSTVINYIKNTMRRSDTKNRTQLALWYQHYLKESQTPAQK